MTPQIERAHCIHCTVPFFLAVPRGMRDLSSPTRVQTSTPGLCKCGALTTGPPGKAVLCQFYKELENLRILVFAGAPGTNPPWILREDCTYIPITK